MTRRHPGFLRFFVLLLAASSGLWAAQSFAQSEQVSVSYSLESSTTTMHEPVIVRVNILNGSKQPITLRLGLDRKESFSLAIKWPDGSAHTDTGAINPWPPIAAAGTSIVLTRSGKTRSILVNGIGKIQLVP